MITQNLKILQERISTACERSGRDVSDVTLIAVSKTHPPEAVKEAYNYGHRHFGENKAQEFRDKTPDLPEDIIWHFIGHLQTNKVKYIIEKAGYIHSVESLKLAGEIEKRAAGIGKVQKILLEVNTAGEESKFGLENKDKLYELAEYCKSSKSLDLAGLMTMAPYTDDESVIRNSFSSLRKLKEELNNNGFNLTELSMGMTNDFQTAIEEGATLLRVGSAIFGDRSYT